MGSLDIEQAARASGLSARDIRLLIEDGRLPASRPAGRWLIDHRHLAAVTPTRPSSAAPRPLGADPVAEEAPSPAGAPQEEAGTLLARLEEAEAQVADLRVERDELRLRLREQVASLQNSLEDSMEELDHARARIVELESSRPSPAPGPRPRAREALTPLFRATTQPRDVG